MQHLSARRALSAVAAVAVAATAVVAGPITAHAATAVRIHLPDVTAAADGAPVTISPTWFTEAEVELSNPRLVYVLGPGLAGVTLTGGGGGGSCGNESPTQVVCTSRAMEIGPEGVSLMFRAAADTARTATAGAEGTVTATFTADGVDPIVTTSRIRVGEAVNLAAGKRAARSVAPGTGFGFPLVVRNAGTTVVRGAAVTFSDDRGLQARTTFSNCRYDGDDVRSCTFDQELTPGVTYRASMPFRLAPDTEAPGVENGDTRWLTAAELEDRLAFERTVGHGVGTAGTGRALTLTADTATPAATSTPQAVGSTPQAVGSTPQAVGSVPQADPSRDNNRGGVEVTVTGTSAADLIAIGAAVTGAAGDEVVATVGVHNSGPATIDATRSDEIPVWTRISVPDGTTVTRVPADCRQVVDGRIDGNSPGQPGFGRYACTTGLIVPAGTRREYPFTLRVDTVIPGVRGSVSVNEEPCDCSQYGRDPDLTNNVAPIVVNG